MDPAQRLSKIEKVCIDSLRVPPVGKAQRPFHEAKANDIAASFDINCFGFPVVCRVDDVNWLVDGQHRVYAIQHSGHAKSTDQIECEVYRGLDLSEMAGMFLGRNHSSPVTAYERFGVAVTAGYSPEVEIEKIVSSAGLKVGYSAKGNVFSVAALGRVYRRNGPEILQRVLLVLRDAYKSMPDAFSGRLLDGLAMVLVTYSRIDDKLLVRALGSDPHGVYGLQRGAEHYRARLGRPVPECVAASAVDIYNERAGRKRRLLKWWKAHKGGRLRRARRS